MIKREKDKNPRLDREPLKKGFQFPKMKEKVMSETHERTVTNTISIANAIRYIFISE